MRKRTHLMHDTVQRVLDVIVSGALLVVLAPVLLVVALLVRVKLGAPVLFVQERPGKRGSLFKLYKFRTMRDARDAHGTPLADDERMTRFGRTLRSTSLDELPELLNILKGDMSFVGPRPLLVQYLPLYSEHQARRHEVRPGLTGLAQVSGRNALSWSERFDLDVRYVDERSLGLDVWIVWRTIATVLSREGVSSEGHVTMEPFAGNSGDIESKGIGASRG